MRKESSLDPFCDMKVPFGSSDKIDPSDESESSGRTFFKSLSDFRQISFRSILISHDDRCVEFSFLLKGVKVGSF